MPSYPTIGSDGEFVDSFSKANLNNHPPRTSIDAPSRDRTKGHDRPNGLKRGYRDRRDRRDRRDDSPPPFRHARESADRSPSPYRRPRDRSPSPYRRPRDRSRDRSPSPYHRGQDSRKDDQSKAHGSKRKGSPPRNNRPEKRYYSDEHRRQYNEAKDTKAYAGRSEVHQRDGHGKGPERSSLPSTTYADNEYTNAVPDFSSVNKFASLDGSRGSKATFTTDARNEGKVELGNPASVERAGYAQAAPALTVPHIEDKTPSEETREEKRRRWALKKAQFAAQGGTKDTTTSVASPLLQQALLGNVSESHSPDDAPPASPGALSESFPSPSFDSPRFSGDSAPASPSVMVVEKQQDGSASPLAEEMSAANYNSSGNMDDDRVRAFQQAHQAESPMDSVEEQTIAPKKKDKDFDMFADEIDDDEGGEQEEQVGAAEGVVLDKKLLGNWTDKDDYYKLIINELIGPAHRYKIVKFLGKGVFANVARAIDTASPAKKLVAIKITRKNDMMRKSAQRELKFLRVLNEEDPQDKRHILRVIDSFDHKGHFCILFEHLDRNLRDLLKDVTKGHGLAFSAVKTYARQIFSGLYHLEHCKVIHFDLKPDNILVSQDLKTIKICDFGTAEDTRDNYDLSEYVVSRFYRSPEIVLGMPFTYAIDMWAIGCTLYELWTGKILFTGASNNQMVRVFMECLGWPSEKLLKKGDRSGIHFEQGPPLQFLSYEADPFNISKMTIRKIEKHRMSVKDLKTRVMAGAQGLTANAPKSAELNDFAELLAACLNWNYEKRIKPKDALNHKVFVNKSLMPRAVVNKPVLPKRGFGGRK